MNEYRERIQQAIGKAEEPLRLLQSGKLDRKTVLTVLHKLDWRKAAVVTLGTAAAASAVRAAAQRRFYQGIVSRELKRQLGPLREQLDEIQAENRQLRRELLKVEEEVQDPAPETPEA